VFVLNLERAMGIELYPQSTSLCDLTALPPPSASNGAKWSQIRIFAWERPV